MSEQFSGYIDYYQDIFSNIWDTNLYEWLEGKAADLQPGQICQSYICYTKKKTFRLEICDPSPLDEEKTKWRLKNLQGKIPIRQERLQEFSLERNEFPIVKVSKLRFVILLKKIEDDWLNPGIADYEEKWLVLPLFSYKNRHKQKYILNDQRLESQFRFYFPPSTNTGFRLSKESAAHYNLIQEVQGNNINAITALNTKKGMQKAFKLSDKALRIVIYHYFKNLNILDSLFDEGKTISDDYQLFKMAINELIEENINKDKVVSQVE